MFVSMLADTIDLQELTTGRRQEGVFAAALAFSGKATAGVGVDHRRLPTAPGGALARRRRTSIRIVTRLGLVAGVLLPLLLLIPLMLGSRYRITRDQHA